jgi:alginate O-acetyltransferase complex protein AlgI
MAHPYDAVRLGFSREKARGESLSRNAIVSASVSAYLPSGGSVLALVAAIVAATLLAALGLSRVRPSPAARVASSILALGATAAVERLTGGEPAGFRMLAIIGTLLYGMKAVVSVEATGAGEPRLSLGRWLAFAALWPGMRPGLFSTCGGPRLPGAGPLFVRGLVRLAFGSLLMVLARVAWASTGSRLLATALALPGMSLILHFGIFNLAAGAFRLLGVPAAPLFRAPLRSRSLAEFWGNAEPGLSEMTSVAVHRPLKAAIGPWSRPRWRSCIPGCCTRPPSASRCAPASGGPLLFALHGRDAERATPSAAGHAIDAQPQWAGLTIAWLVLPLRVPPPVPWLEWSGRSWAFPGHDPSYSRPADSPIAGVGSRLSAPIFDGQAADAGTLVCRGSRGLSFTASRPAITGPRWG